MKTRNEIIEEAKIALIPDRRIGGQMAGTLASRVSLRHEDTGFYIEVEAYGSQYKNKRLAITLFDLYLSEAFKL